MLRVTELVLHLHLQRRLQDGLRQIAQKAARADQLHAFAPCTLDQILGQLLIRRGLHDRRHLIRHYELPSASHAAGKSGPRSYTVSRTVPRQIERESAKLVWRSHACWLARLSLYRWTRRDWKPCPIPRFEAADHVACVSEAEFDENGGGQD
jgi:hypothetical protein